MFFTYGYFFYVPISIIYALMIIRQGISKKRGFYYYFFAMFFAIYLNFAIKLVFFPLVLNYGLFENTRLSYYLDFSLNFIGWASYQTIGNIALTIPIAICLPFFTNFKNKGRLIFTLIFSISFEVIQLILILLVRADSLIFDIKDIILNVLGGLIGYFIFTLSSKILVKINSDSIPSKQNTFWSYILKTCHNCVINKRSLDFGNDLSE